LSKILAAPLVRPAFKARADPGVKASTQQALSAHDGWCSVRVALSMPADRSRIPKCGWLLSSAAAGKTRTCQKSWTFHPHPAKWKV